MPKKAGHRYPLVIYAHVINRWWPTLLTISLIMLGGGGWKMYRQSLSQSADSWRWLVILGVGGITLFFTFFLLIIRRLAYVRPYQDHLRLVTPFLQMRISYKRILRTTTADMWSLFPPKKMSGTLREIVSTIPNRTAVVIELNKLPMSRNALRFFLSPLFFKDHSPHLVILVKEWMRFSTELDTLRLKGDQDESGSHRRRVDNSILSRLPKQ
jgi:hypothetical protein